MVRRRGAEVWEGECVVGESGRNDLRKSSRMKEWRWGLGGREVKRGHFFFGFHPLALNDASSSPFPPSLPPPSLLQQGKRRHTKM